jgi:hypothetical protein
MQLRTVGSNELAAMLALFPFCHYCAIGEVAGRTVEYVIIAKYVPYDAYVCTYVHTR